MADWYYYNESDEKVGPIRGRELKQLARQGTVTPETRVIDENGRTALAKSITGLTFSETAQADSVPSESSTVSLPPTTETENGTKSTADTLGDQLLEQLRDDFERLQEQQEQGTQTFTTPIPLSAASNPFTATTPTGPNPVAGSTAVPPIAQSVPVPPIEKSDWSSWQVTLVGIVCLFIAGGIAMSIFAWDRNTRDAAEAEVELVVEVDEPLPQLAPIRANPVQPRPEPPPFQPPHIQPQTRFRRFNSSLSNPLYLLRRLTCPERYILGQ